MICEIGPETFEGGSGGEGALGAVHYLEAMAFQDGDEEVCELLIGLHAQVLPVEPLGFVKIEAGAGLDYAVQGEDWDKLVYGVKLPFSAGVPAKESKEVHEGFREVAVLAVTAGDFAGFRVLPPKGEDGEAKAVAVTLTQLSLAVRLKEQAQVGEPGHGVRPAKRLIQKVMERK